MLPHRNEIEDLFRTQEWAFVRSEIAKWRDGVLNSLEGLPEGEDFRQMQGRSLVLREFLQGFEGRLLEAARKDE